MNWFARLEDILFWAVTSVVGALATGGAWLIRRVLTNQKQIELLQAEIRHRDQLRSEDRDRMAGIEEGIDEIKSYLIEGRK